MKTPYAIIIRDGFGHNPNTQFNAISDANTPNNDNYIKNFPTTFIKTDSQAVGLPEGTMGSSEVGHLNIGAGRVVWQSLARINEDIKSGEYAKNNAIVDSINKAKQTGSTLHLMGLTQDAGVHAHSSHTLATLQLAKDLGMDSNKVLLHIITDGRDTAPSSAKEHIKLLTDWMDKENFGAIATVTGRYFAMDRDTNWDRIQLAYDIVARGISQCNTFSSALNAIDDAYNNDETDEFVQPRCINNYQGIKDGDVFFFTNFRFDRTRELTKAFILNDFAEFATVPLKDFTFLAMTNYYDGMQNSNRASVQIAYAPIIMKNLLGPYLSNLGKTQLRIAETEKYAHVTFFFNGQSDEKSPGEVHMGPDSPKVATYDLQPEMSAKETADMAIEQIEKGEFDVIIMNFANCDMVGHTGIHPAIIKAVETVDYEADRVIQAILKHNGVAIVSADHGNSEQTQDYTTGEPMTSHTTFDVWASVISNRDDLQSNKIDLRSDGALCDLAPTLLDVMNIEQPAEMTGKSLIIQK